MCLICFFCQGAQSLRPTTAQSLCCMPVTASHLEYNAFSATAVMHASRRPATAVAATAVSASG